MPVSRLVISSVRPLAKYASSGRPRFSNGSTAIIARFSSGTAAAVSVSGDGGSSRRVATSADARQGGGEGGHRHPAPMRPFAPAHHRLEVRGAERVQQREHLVGARRPLGPALGQEPHHQVGQRARGIPARRRVIGSGSSARWAASSACAVSPVNGGEPASSS